MREIHYLERLNFTLQDIWPEKEKSIKSYKHTNKRQCGVDTKKGSGHLYKMTSTNHLFIRFHHGKTIVGQRRGHLKARLSFSRQQLNSSDQLATDDSLDLSVNVSFSELPVSSV